MIAQTLSNLLKVFLLIIVTSFTFADYRLSTGDEIRIQTYGEDDLTFNSITIGSTGQFSFPFVGQVVAKGQTPEQIQSYLESKLKPDYLVNPKVTVTVVKFRQFYINGEVKSPGGIDYQPGLNLRKAVTLAGGFTERASRTGMYVIREGEESSKGTKVDLNYEVLPGDVITIQTSFF